MGTPFGEPMGTPGVTWAWRPDGRVREYPELMEQ
jgi:hypothetical protein